MLEAMVGGLVMVILALVAFVWGRRLVMRAEMREAQSTIDRVEHELSTCKLAALSTWRVEEYQIEVKETEGFKKLFVRFEDEAGQVHRFEFSPAYAYAFSDDIVRAAARAAPQTTGEATA